MTDRSIYCNGIWRPEAEAMVSMYDLSVMQGAAAFEMLRSFNKVHFKLLEHLARLKESCRLLMIPLPDDFERLPSIIEELTERNKDAFRADDEYRLLIVVSPGCASMYREIAGTTPHSYTYATIFPLRYTVRGMGRLFEEGVRLSSGSLSRHDVFKRVSVWQAPYQTIPSTAKHRSRAHFHLAQQQADPEWALLRTPWGAIAEGPGFNIAYWNALGWRTPALHCLDGISMRMVLSLMGGKAIRQPLLLDVCREETWPREIVVTATPFGVLPVVSVDGRPVHDGRPGPAYRATLAAWSKAVGVDIAGQIQRWDAEAGC